MTVARVISETAMPPTWSVKKGIRQTVLDKVVITVSHHKVGENRQM
jgi:hypothetical protein